MATPATQHARQDINTAAPRRCAFRARRRGCTFAYELYKIFALQLQRRRQRRNDLGGRASAPAVRLRAWGESRETEREREKETGLEAASQERYARARYAGALRARRYAPTFER
jgi:hypothetical protein